MVEKINSILPQSVEFSHFLLKRCLKEGDFAIDATAGNGYDTEFMAKLVGTDGKIFAFDIQAQAIENTNKLLQENNIKKRVDLINDGHENINRYITGKIIKAVIFNLGYLPGGNKEIITQPKTTLAALQASLEVLISGGIIILVVYSGHHGGEKEKDSLINFTNNLNYKLYNVLNYKFINQSNPPPQIIAIEKR